MPGFIAALIAKLAGVGTVAKAALAAATAALTLGVAGGATGVLPLPGGSGDAAVIARGAIDQATAAVNSAVASVPATSGTAAVQAAGGAAVTSPAGSTSTHAETATSTAANSAKLPTVPNVVVPTVPALPAIPRCVADLIPTGTTVPDPARLVAQLPACVLSVVSASLPLDTIQSVIGTANLPVDVSRCLWSVLRSVPTFAGGNLSGLPKLLSACLPTGSIPGMGSIPGAGSIPGLGSGSIPGLSSISRFMPGH